jgi:glycosyltransferase involved in cell wall biosynthesis
MLIPKSDVLIILPAYNEGLVIGNVISDIQEAGYTNICLIDDGCTDNTSKIARIHGVHVLKHPINRGVGATIQTGIDFAKQEMFQFAVLMDSDGQHLSQDIFHLLNRMTETHADIVIGNRFRCAENIIPKHRIIYNKVANIFTNLLCKDNYEDSQCGFRLLNRKSIEALNLKSKGFGFCSEMLIVSEKLNLKIEQTPIRVLYTEYSMQKGQNFRIGIRTARSILWQKVFG